MLELLHRYIRSLNVFSEAEIGEAVSLFEYREFERYEFFAKEGKKSEELVFVESGVFHSFYTTPEAEEVTIQFYCENSIVSAYASFVTGQPSNESIQAMTPANVWALSKKKTDPLVEKYLSWNRFFKAIADTHYLELERKVIFQKYSAKERYLHILEKYPECILETPLKELALYLGITQRHLSRIRKEVSQEATPY